MNGIEGIQIDQNGNTLVKHDISIDGNITSATTVDNDFTVTGDAVVGGAANTVGFFGNTGTTQVAKSSIANLPALLNYLQSLGLLS